MLLFDEERIRDDKDYREELRHRCRTDHMFLAPLLGYTKFHPIIHGPAADLYVKKNPHLPIEEQHEIKNRMHLDPRHTYKTTMGIVDTVQWIICFPNITIMNETATLPLANALTSTQARKFYKSKTAQPTMFQILFPEWIVDKEPDGTYRAPCQTEHTVEETLMSTSVRASQSGWHPHIFQPDDAADTENSGLQAGDTVRRGVWARHSTNLNTLRHGGYINMRGTRYHPFDIYGMTLKTMVPGKWLTLIRGSLIVKNGKRLKEGFFPREEDVILTMPELLDYDTLKAKFYGDYQAFMCQQQNDPQGGALLLFPEEFYHQQRIPPQNIHPLGSVEVCWRIPYEGKDYMRKYAEGAAAKHYDGRTYIIDAWRGHFTPTELAEEIVDSCKRVQAGDLILEEIPGLDYLMPHIRNESAKQNWSLQITRVPFENDDNIRAARIEQMQPQMKAGRLWISTEATQEHEVKNQFTNYGLTLENGIMDAISRLSLRIPASVVRENISETEARIRTNMRSRQMWNMVYGQAGAEIAEAAEKKAAEPPPQQQNSYGLTPMLGGLDG